VFDSNPPNLAGVLLLAGEKMEFKGLVCSRLVGGAGSLGLARDGNGYPTPETRQIFTLLWYRYGLISIPMGFLMGDNMYPAGTRARVWDRSTRTRKPTGFLNPT
jgi:hypothetical protein